MASRMARSRSLSCAKSHTRTMAVHGMTPFTEVPHAIENTRWQRTSPAASVSRAAVTVCCSRAKMHATTALRTAPGRAVLANTANATAARAGAARGGRRGNGETDP
jgi:hypothetical protein